MDLLKCFDQKIKYKVTGIRPKKLHEEIVSDYKLISKNFFVIFFLIKLISI